MKLEAQPRLWKDISSIPKAIKREVLQFMDDAEHMTIADLCLSYDFKPMRNSPVHYRLRIEDYRLDCRYDRAGETLLLMRLLHREVVYNHFPF
jgi:mRNA-degrading endonuclease RelE of RelBE toxin-antitoxin system